ncbi:MAG: class I SAM-dependent RNA methyltransferase [Clostridiaceae bacterium]|nr:class I SAM-dependent RNA methyltransferase [Clostridiaceae bacterium]
MKTYEFCAPCLIGVESIAAGEFRRLGFENVRCEDGHVYFTGGDDTLARANIHSRYCERILIRLGSFPADDFDKLFDGVRRIAWEEYLAPGTAFPVKGYSLRSKLTSIPACQRIIKKAVAERLMAKRRVTWLDESGPAVQIQFSIIRDRADIFIDTTGAPLYKRGWRTEGGVAPIRETLAASMVDLSRFRGDMHFLDPMCGSGTIAIEAALKARRRAPGINRRFDAQGFPFVDRAVWNRAREEAKAGEMPSPAVIEARDIDPACIRRAEANARRAGVADMIRFSVADVTKSDLSSWRGVMVTNPPYGERLGDQETAHALYRGLGRALGTLDGKSVYVITPDPEFEKFFGHRANRKRWLYNGMIKCSLYMYFPGK